MYLGFRLDHQQKNIKTMSDKYPQGAQSFKRKKRKFERLAI